MGESLTCVQLCMHTYTRVRTRACIHTHGANITAAGAHPITSLIRMSHVIHMDESCYMYAYVMHGVATTSRLLKITGLFCKRAL